MLWGIVIGTYSSLFIAAPLLYYIRPKRSSAAQGKPRPRRPRSANRSRKAMDVTPLIPAGRQVIDSYGAQRFPRQRHRL